MRQMKLVAGETISPGDTRPWVSEYEPSKPATPRALLLLLLLCVCVYVRGCKWVCIRLTGWGSPKDRARGRGCDRQ